MQLTVEAVAAAVPLVCGLGALIWGAARKLTTIENKVDSALEWIGEQRQHEQPARMRKRERR